MVTAGFVTRTPLVASALGLAAGFAIGIGYQFLPFLHGRSRRMPDMRLGVWLVASSIVSFILALLVVGFASELGGVGLALLVASLASLLVGLTELHPIGQNIPGMFLIPVGPDGLMLQTLAPHWSNPAQAAVALALFLPATITAALLTVWAFRIRQVNKALYAKATETARGVLWAWILLVVGVLMLNGLGLTFGEGEWTNLSSGPSASSRSGQCLRRRRQGGADTWKRDTCSLTPVHDGTRS